MAIDKAIDSAKEAACRLAEANAIREKTGGTAPINYDYANRRGFAAAIASIAPAKPEQSKTLTLGAAAPSTVTPDSGKVLSSVPVSLDTSVIKAENIKKDVQMLGITGTHEDGEGLPIDVPTAVGMDAVLIAANVGKVYRFTGTTDATYTNGDLYIVEAV